MHQSTIPSLSQTIWPRWASRQFLSLRIVQTLLPVTFGYFLSSEAVVMWQLRRWKRLWRRSLTRSHKRTSMGAFEKLLERYKKCIAARGDYFEEDLSFMCVLSIKVPIRKKSGNLFNDPRMCVFIYICMHVYISIFIHRYILHIYIYVCVCIYICVCVYVYVYIFVCVCVCV